MSSQDELNEGGPTFMMEDVPQVFSFRLQSSIIAEDQVQELHLPVRAAYGNEEAPLTSRLETEGSVVDKDGKMLQSVSVRTEEAEQCHVFLKAHAGDDNKSVQRWNFKGSSKSNRRIVLQSSKELKDVGIRARARLEEEKNKRPEIQILDQMPTSDPEKMRSSKKATTSFSAKVASQKTAATTESGSRKRKLVNSSSRPKSTQQPRSAKKSGVLKSSRGSSWVPDVSHIELPDQQERSATVKLHGLPIQCTVEHIKKFFAGLQLQYISILLPNNTTIPQLDASNSPSSKHSRRGEHHGLRVLAHFRSVSAAMLAFERSGETIRLQSEDTNPEEEEFVVAVTILRTQLAEALLFLTVPAGPRTPLETTLSDITTMKLHPMIEKVLWSVVVRRMLHDSLPLERGLRNEEIVLSDDALWDDPSGTGTWHYHPGYLRFAKHYNRLVDIQDELLRQIPYPIVEAISSRRSHFERVSGDKDPVARLTTEACKLLTSELDIIEGLLYRARVSYQIGSKK